MNAGTVGRFRITENVAYSLFDENGKRLPLFHLNELGTTLLKTGKISPFDQTPEYGQWKEEPMVVSNLITNAGFAAMASRLNGSGAEAAFTYIALGTGATAATVSDTTLQTEITTNGGQRAAATASRTTTGVSNDTAQLLKVFTVTADFVITESGVFNAASGGVMLSRQLPSAINLLSGKSLEVIWKYDFN